MATKTIVVLGTSAQVPKKNRNHVALYLRWDKEDLLFDPGEGTQRQMVTFGVPLNRIRKIFITHFHGDHCLGLPGVIQRLSLHQVSHPVEIIYPRRGEKFLRALLSCAVFHNRVELVPVAVEESGFVEVQGELRVEAVRLDHGVETFGYRISDPIQWNIVPERLPPQMERRLIGVLKRQGWVEVSGKRVNLEDVAVKKQSQSFAFCMDTRYCEGAVRLAKGVDVLACEATYLQEDEALAHEYMHLTSREAATIALKGGVGKLILMHFSQRYPHLSSFEEEARSIFPHTHVAHDGMKITLPQVKRDIQS